MRSRYKAASLLIPLALGMAFVIQPAQASHLQNVKVPSKADGLLIAITIYKPATASPTNKVPVILHSHGWGGSRSNSETAFSNFLSAGFGVVSIDQRGHGQTGGTAYVQNPAFEGQDIISVIDHVAELDWVKKDRDKNGNEIANDPVLGAVGGSYGGGYQLITALTETSESGRTRFNALAPEITWNDLPRSLAPADVPRTLWNTTLYAAGVNKLPDYVHQSFAIGTATATFPHGQIPGVYNLKDRFYRNSPAWFAENGVNLDIPVLFRQGTSDNLFTLTEAYHNYYDVLTPAARAKSILIGYNGGHNLPSVVPVGTNTEAALVGSGDGCSGDGGFAARTIEFFTAAFGGGETRPAETKPFNLTTTTGECLRVDRLDSYTSLPVGTGVVATPTAGSPPVGIEIAQGPITLAGIPRLRGTLTSLGVDARAFFSLSVGATPATAQIIQNNVLPIRRLLPVTGESLTMELPGVAVVIPAGQNLYLTVTAVSDMFVGTARTPGVIIINDAVVDLPRS